MFYWSHKDTHIVLNDEEEMKLIQKLGKFPVERIGYFTSQKLRKQFEQKIFRYLKESLYADPEAFNRRFVFRSCYDEEAQKMFPVMLDAYGRITRRATIGLWGDTSPLDESLEKIKYKESGTVFRITLFERPRWPWGAPSVSAQISLPAQSIEKLSGTVDNFFIAGDKVAIKFNRDFVRISLLDTGGKPNQTIYIDQE